MAYRNEKSRTIFYCSTEPPYVLSFLLYECFSMYEKHAKLSDFRRGMACSIDDTKINHCFHLCKL